MHEICTVRGLGAHQDFRGAECKPSERRCDARFKTFGGQPCENGLRIRGQNCRAVFSTLDGPMCDLSVGESRGGAREAGRQSLQGSARWERAVEGEAS